MHQLSSPQAQTRHHVYEARGQEAQSAASVPRGHQQGRQWCCCRPPACSRPPTAQCGRGPEDTSSACLSSSHHSLGSTAFSEAIAAAVRKPLLLQQCAFLNIPILRGMHMNNTLPRLFEGNCPLFMISTRWSRESQSFLLHFLFAGNYISKFSSRILWTISQSRSATRVCRDLSLQINCQTRRNYRNNEPEDSSMQIRNGYRSCSAYHCISMWVTGGGDQGRKGGWGGRATINKQRAGPGRQAEKQQGGAQGLCVGLVLLGRLGPGGSP